MSDFVIRAEGLGKKYQISHRRPERYTALRDVLTERVTRLLRGAGGGATGNVTEEFWALRDVSFEINRGDVVAIVGANGAGKSTLLKLLSRITEPSRGRATLRGRVASLLEVGTGFHPELTGRENISLNGAILGMTRAEIRARFDAIVGFAEVERFLDTPVKRYSSGMHVRLAFAVAAHLDPEILVVDEVLAVGDAAFQARCLGKMSDVARSGRTVLFVSHNMAAVRLLCRRGLFLETGRLVYDGSVEGAIEAYQVRDSAGPDKTWRRSSPPDAPIYFEAVTPRLEGSQPAHRLVLELVLRSRGVHKPAFLAADIHDGVGGTIMQAEPAQSGFLRHDNERHAVTMEIELPPLVPGVYPVSVWVGSHNTETFDWVKSCVRFEVTHSPSVDRTFPYTPDHGFIVPRSVIRYGVAREGAEAPGERKQ